MILGTAPGGVRRDSAAPNEWVPAACVNDRAGYARNRLWITNGQFKKDFLPRGPQSSERGTKCVDTGNSCGAGIFDGALAPRLLSDVLAVMAPALKSGEAHAARTLWSAHPFRATPHSCMLWWHPTSSTSPTRASLRPKTSPSSESEWRRR